MNENLDYNAEQKRQELKMMLEQRQKAFESAVENNADTETLNKLRNELVAFQKEILAPNFPDQDFQQLKHTADIYTKLQQEKKAPEDHEISAEKFTEDLGINKDDFKIKH